MSGTNTGARLKSEAVREVAFGSITSTLTQLGAAIGFTIKAVRFVNGTDADMYFSYYGGVNNIRVQAGTAFTFDLQTNNMCLVPGDVIKIADTGVAATSGYAWVETFYT